MTAPLASDFVLAMRAPRAFYEREDDATARRSLAPRLALVMLTLGAFVSFTTAGRLAPSHLVGTTVGWCFLPLLQALSLAIALRVGGARRDLRAAYGAYLAGHGPWLLLLCAVSSVCLFARDVASALGWLLRSGILPGALLATTVWSVMLQHALMRVSARRAGLATATFYATFVALVVGWYVANGDLLPLLGVFV